MITAIIVFHVLACFFLIFVVLLQPGKGGDMGTLFGGGSQTAFGGRGAGTVLSKMTTITAVVFMLTSLALTTFSSWEAPSLIRETKAPTSEEPLPAAPAAQGPEEAAPKSPETPPVSENKAPTPVPIPAQAPAAPVVPTPAAPPAAKK